VTDVLGPGDPVPPFRARTRGNPAYAFDSVAGRHVAVTLIGRLAVPGVAAMVRALREDDGLFDDERASHFVVTADPADLDTLPDRYPGVRTLADDGFAAADAFGCRTGDDLRLATFLLDPGLRVVAVLPVEDADRHAADVHAAMRALLGAAPADGLAPVLVVPHLLEPALCRRFIDYCESQGAEDSGYMKTDPATGRTVLVVDHHHKRRSDCLIEDEELRAALRHRVMRRLVPAIQRAFQFRVSRMERYLIGRYDSATGGHFRPHKDNTTRGTAHRRFAVSINLDADAHEGGDLRFPEFGRRTYRPPTGGAVVFSCSLLHEATPVTAGVRHCILPFLYDEAAAQVRLENARYLDDPALRDQVIASVTAR
jgi:predicted 2-oxoglutarate/Fe(II)-dependent dioxygenase YbiX/peroxiredoxin